MAMNFSNSSFVSASPRTLLSFDEFNAFKESEREGLRNVFGTHSIADDRRGIALGVGIVS